MRSSSSSNSTFRIDQLHFENEELISDEVNSDDSKADETNSEPLLVNTEETSQSEQREEPVEGEHQGSIMEITYSFILHSFEHENHCSF
ncbi:hypothetical protein ACR2XN_28870, partial [Klebsiella pneumoniae]